MPRYRPNHNLDFRLYHSSLLLLIQLNNGSEPQNLLLLGEVKIENHSSFALGSSG